MVQPERQLFVKGFNIKAIVIGALGMLMLDVMTGIVSFVVFSGDALPAGATQDEIRAVAEVVAQSDGYLLVGLVLGTFSTVLGGYVAARVAKNLPLLNACAVGVVGIAVGALIGGQGESPWWFDAIGYLSTVPAAIVGGFLGKRAMKTGA